MASLDEEAQQLKSVALQNAHSILLARQRAEDELVRTKDALRESQERLRAALRAAGTGTFRWNISTRTLEWDSNLDRLFGLEPGQTIESLGEFLDAVHADDRGGVTAQYERCARDGSDLEVEFRVVWPDGRTHWIAETAKAVFGEDGRPLYMTGACADITSRKAAAEALRQNEERLRAIFNQAAVGIAVAGLSGRFLDLNAKFSDILGYRADELQEMTFADITHPDDLSATLASMRQLLAGSVPDYSIEKRYLRKDRTVVWSLTTVTILTDAAGQPQRFIGVIEDITRRKQAEADNTRLYEAAQHAAAERELLLERERAARSEAERMSALKDEFLATLSHELRTPLNAILGWSQLLKSVPKDPADLSKGLETIERNARAQTRLIDDLLDMSRVTSGKLRLDVQPLQPILFIDAAVETVQAAADAKGIRLEKALDPSAGPISGDAGRLQQVVWNVLSNAIKFTPRNGEVHILLDRVFSHVEITVVDTGVGISADFMPHVFERFRQADASTTRRHGGLGLGLSIVRSLVESHGGTVAVKSPGEGLGTTVTVQLPLLAVHGHTAISSGAAEPAAVTITPTELAGLRILVVDDQPDARDLISRVLEHCGAQVMTAGAADEVLHLVETQRPDVLVSDIGMPGADGFELLRRVRALGAERGGNVPAIALTAFARPEDRTRALRAGFLVHVSKPVTPSDLVATVAAVAGRIG